MVWVMGGVVGRVDEAVGAREGRGTHEILITHEYVAVAVFILMSKSRSWYSYS